MSKPKLNQSKNIVISTQCFPPISGGMENLMGGIAENLYKNKFNVFIFADSKNKLEEDKYDKNLNYEIIRYKGIKIIRKRRKSKDIIKFIQFKKNINSIICDSWKSAENLIKRKIQIKQKIFCLAHGNDILVNNNLIKKKRIKKTFNQLNYIVANSYFTKKKIIDLGVTPKKIKVIYPGVDNFNVKDKNNRYKKFKNFSPILVTIARLEKRKNHKLIIYAIKDLIKEFKDLIYLIAGDGPEKKSIYKLINKLNLERNIKILGKVNEKDKNYLLNISKLHVMPTIDEKRLFSVEGFGISYIEAARNGIPSISSGVGGTKESVLNNKTGIFCDPKDISSIKYSIRKLLSDKKTYKNMSKNSKNFSNKFLWKNIIKKYL
ncbi:MAG: GDP-mannose-dependent alpha-(1-6)-phosphatidylinositol monomannoside mannosyltransferase, partial [Alphaproteobacteria bacterium MarineAlpha6_Bin6]